MKREFWAEFDLYGNLQKSNGQSNKRLLDGWVERKGETATPWNQLRDAAARQSLLAQATVSTAKVEFQDKKGKIRSAKVREYARTGALQYEEKGGLFYWYYGEEFPNPGGPFQDFLLEQLQHCAKVLGYQTQEIQYNKDTETRSGVLTVPALPDLSLFPPGTWAIQVTFTLRKPYISRDDVDFYILDNPVKKEWVFKVPYMAPSQWKGALRAAMIRELTIQLQEIRINEADFVKRRLQLYRLFGNEKDGTAEFLNRTLTFFRVGPLPQDANDEETQEEWKKRVKQEMETVAEEFVNLLKEKGYRRGDNEGFQGRLRFYATFFDKIGMEVINPHDRETGAGKHPIYFECVPAETSGVFTLLYVPIGGGPKDEETCKADLEAVAQGIRAMLTTYGFGAKTSSGYGVADVTPDDDIKVEPTKWRERFIHAWTVGG